MGRFEEWDDGVMGLVEEDDGVERGGVRTTGPAREAWIWEE